MPTSPQARPPALRLLERKRPPRPAALPTEAPQVRVSWWERLFFGIRPAGNR